MTAKGNSGNIECHLAPYTPCLSRVSVTMLLSGQWEVVHPIKAAAMRRRSATRWQLGAPCPGRGVAQT